MITFSGFGPLGFLSLIQPMITYYPFLPTCTREILPVKSHDQNEKHLKIDLLEQVVRKMSSHEGAVMDAGFKLSQVQQAGLKGYLLRLAKNFTARRNEPAPR